MRNLFVIAFLSLSVGACAQVNTTIMVGAKTVVHDVNLGGCHFIMTDPFNGQLGVYLDEKPNVANYYGPLYQKGPEKNDLWIQMWCEKSSDELFRDCAINLKDGRLNTTNTEGEREEVIRMLNQQRVVLKGKNWNGAGYTEDQINGDEEQRIRSFHFCAVNGEKTIYGRAESAAQLENLKESAMPNIIELLEGIEFIDDTGTTAPATNTH